MKTLVIDSTPWVTQWSIETKEGPSEYRKSHRTVGRNHSSSYEWIWTEGNQNITSFSDQTGTLVDLWRKVLSTNQVNELLEPMRLLVGAAKSVIDAKERLGQLVYLIPENLSEVGQNVILAELSNQFGVAQSEVYLLWRPVALALGAIRHVGNSEAMVIADFAHLDGGVAELVIKTARGLKAPVRDFMKPRGRGRSLDESLDDWLGRNYETGDSKPEYLETSSVVKMASHLGADLNFDPPLAWCQDGLNFRPLPPCHEDFARPVEFEHTVTSARSFIESLVTDRNVISVWHGWPVYWQGDEVVQRNFGKSILGEPQLAVEGGVEFARRRRLNLPTYFEVLPGYAIWCQTSELGMPRRHQWESLIRKRVVDGTTTVKDDPIDRFQINPGTLKFPLNIRMGESTKYRFVEAELPSQIDTAAPILIHSQIRPTGGGVKIALAPRDEPDLFGKNARVALKWDQAEERSVSAIETATSMDHRYSYPFIIQSGGSYDSRLQLENISSAIRAGASIQNYIGALSQILVPTLANAEIGVPFGGRQVREGLSENVQFLVNEICRFAHARITDDVNAPGADWKWTRLVSCLFLYADEDIQDALFDRAMDADYPVMGGPAAIPLSQAFYAFGRTCRNAEHLERFLRQTLAEWDSLERAPWVVFWPFQKCLGNYGEPARVPSDLVASVMRCAVELLDRIIEGRLPAPQVFGMSNWKKWTLSAILFGLRRRELDSKFMDLDSGDSLAADVRARLLRSEIFNTPIPPIALAGIEIPGHPPTLPELILRFLEARADETDIAIAGGIGLTS